MFDDNIPLPKPDHPQFRRMKVGQSVFVPHDGGIMKCAAYLYAATIQKRSDLYRFSGKSVVENGVKGVRIWRTR
jgi:hypothetical protein